MESVIKMKELRIIDIDGTTLNNRLFAKKLAAAVAALYPHVDADEYLAELKHFYGQCGYELESHLEHYGICFNAVREALLTELGKVQLLFPDARDLLVRSIARSDVHIWLLTVGDRPTQMFKYELIMRELRKYCGWDVPDIDIEVLSWPKGRILARRLSGSFRRGRMAFDIVRMVDDNPSQFDGLVPIKGLYLYLVSRSDAKNPRCSIEGVMAIDAITTLAI